MLPFAYLVFSGPTFDSSGQPDNAPYLAKGLLIFLTPVVLALLVAYFFVLPLLLSKLQARSLSALVSAAAVVATAVGVALYRAEAGSGAPAYAAQQAAVLAGLLFLILATGEVARWLRRRAAA